ncbi:uncharacterized protein si:dkey-250k15.4 [Thunnus maccoyii]|uniref:uncharacterized protein si:dkey-250k15.4 n=1 Tax=Thunnus maccoyii TaxID=8240 RepID=UPI001C4B3802|nr:uncharacterized protein si:dkey-250k15.4 [Thunnus maccoyii]
MSHMCVRALSEKEKVLNVFNKPFKTTDENSCLVNRATANCKCLNHCSKTDGQQKMKRLRKRKERSQMRGGGKEASKTKSHQHYCRQSSKDMAHFHNCCHSSCHCPSRSDAPFLNVVPAAQEPSIITDSRLIGHHGLFNHEVKSIDIERLLTEKRKLEKSGKQVQKKVDATSHPPATSHIPSPFSSNGLFGGDTDEVVPFEKKADLATKTHYDCQEKEKKILQSDSQGSDITPGQRPQQQLDLSSGSYKSDFLSKHSSLDVVIMKSNKANSVTSEKGRVSELTPTCERGNVKTLNKKVKGQTFSTLEHTPKNQEPPVHQTQAHGLSPSPLQVSSSPMAGASDNFDIQYRRKDLDCVSKSVSAVAARLCCNLQFPLLRKRNLLSESREVLLKALQERHGPRLQENLLEVQRCLSFDTECARTVQDKNQRPILIDEDGLWSTDAFTAAFQADSANQSCFGTQKTTAFKMTGSKRFNWNASLQPHQSLEQTAGWLTSPVETSVSLLGDILRPSCSPQFCMDFEPSRTSSSDHLFAPSLFSCWGATTSASQHWEDSFNRSKTKESVMFDSSENSFMSHTRAIREGSNRLQYSDHNIQPFFPNQAQLPDGHSAEPRQFPQEHDSFENEKCSFAPAFSAQIHQPQQSNHQPFSQFSHPPTCSSLRSHHSDMMNYPPSHMLERSPAPPLSSFPSPEHWSFPPMRLY